MEWNDDLCLQLIQLYRDNPILWDPRNINYKLSKKKIDIWQSIAGELGCEVTEVRKKMESLLTSYRREWRREGTTHSGMGEYAVYHSKWFAFKEMQFLNDKFRPRKTQNTMNEVDFDASEEINESVDMSQDSQVSQHENIEEDNLNNEQGQEIIAHTEISKSKTCTASTVTSKKREREDPRINEAFNIMKNIDARKASKIAKTESTLYGEYVATQLEKFDNQTRALVKHKFGNILFEAEMGMYRAPPNQTVQWSNSSSPSTSSLISGYASAVQQFEERYHPSSLTIAAPTPSPTPGTLFTSTMVSPNPSISGSSNLYQEL